MMSHYSKLFISATFLAVVAVFAIASTPNEVPGETLARMQKLGEKLATPNENHAFLQILSGSWNTESSIMGMDSETGSAEYEMIFGNRFLDGTHEGSVAGIPFVGKLTIGYDNYKHKFVASFFDNLGTSINTAEGTLNRSGNILSLWGTMDEWMTDEHDKPVMYRFRAIDENHFTFEVHDLSNDMNTTVILTTYRRAKSIDEE